MFNLKVIGLIAGTALTMFFGFCFGVVFVSWGAVSFDGTISAGDVIRMATTVLTAIIVSVFLKGILDANQNEKELVMQQLGRMLDIIGELESMPDSQESVELVSVNSVLKKLSVKSSFIRTAFGECSFCKRVDYPQAISQKIKEVRELMTYTPGQRAENFVKTKAPVYVKEALVTWLDERKHGIDSKLEELKNEIFVLQLKINRL